jgi:hypothetical protein
MTESQHPLLKKIMRFLLAGRGCSDTMGGAGDGPKPRCRLSLSDVLLKALPLKSNPEGKGFGFEKDGKQNKPRRNGIPSGNLGSLPPKPFL